MEAEQALAAVLAFGEQEPEFAAVWERSVRDAADRSTARITGEMMAGQREGSFGWEARIPYPVTVTEDEAEEAYRLAVKTEVSRRLSGMDLKFGGAGRDLL